MSTLCVIVGIWLFITILVSVYKGSKTNNSFDVKNVLPLRGILAISIIAVHLNHKLHDMSFMSSFVSWGVYIVSIFFFVTGYGLTRAYIEKDAYLDDFINKRVKKVLFPYLFCVFFYQLYQYSQYHSFNYFVHIIKAGCYFPDVLLPTSWFVIVILVFYVLFYFALRINRSIKIGMLLLIICSIVYYSLLRYWNWGYFWTESVFSINLGMIFSYYEKKIKSVYVNNVGIINFGGILSFLVIYILLPIISANYNIPIPHRFSLLFLNLLPLFVVLAIYNQGLTQSKILNFLGTISYEIYLVQGAFCYMLWQVTKNPLLYIVMVFSISILSAWGLKKLFISF